LNARLRCSDHGTALFWRQNNSQGTRREIFEKRAAFVMILASIIETCKLNNVDPEADLADVCARLVQTIPPIASTSFFRRTERRATKLRGRITDYARSSLGPEY
jgi:hypothetical protein